MIIFESAKQYSLEQVVDLVRNISKNITLILLVEEDSKFDALSKETLNDNIQLIGSAKKKQIIDEAKQKLKIPFDNLLNELLNDENYFLFRDRKLPSRARRGFPIKLSNYHFQFLVVQKLYDVTWFHLAFKPDYRILYSTPHSMGTWINVKVAKALGIKILLLHRTFIPGWLYVGEGLGRQNRFVELHDDGSQSSFKKEVDQYVEKLKLTYNDAIPTYEKERLKRNNGKIFKVTYLIRKNITRPSWILNAMRSWKALKSLSVLGEEFKAKSYFIFFIHYQPERTTLPEGYGYTQVLNIIYSIRSKLDRDVELLIKEHPSTFTNNCDPNYRHPAFYRNISQIAGVNLVDIAEDNFKLIDNALCIVTVTGTVAFESLVRGTAVINYGVPVFKKSYGFHVFKSEIDLSNFIRRARNDEFDSQRISTEAVNNLKAMGKFVVRDNPINFREAKYNALRRLNTDLL